LAAGRPKLKAKPPSEILVSHVVLAFWKHIKTAHLRGDGQPVGTHLKYRPALKLLRKRYGHTRAADFRRKSLKALRLAMIKRGNSRNYINETTRRPLLVFAWASGAADDDHDDDEALIDPEVYRNLSTLKALKVGKAKELPAVEPVEDALVEATLSFLPRVVADMVRIQRLTAARPGEICRMRPCDVERVGDVWKYVPSEHKTKHLGHARVIFIGPKARRLLRPYLRRPAGEYCFSPAESEQQRRKQQHANRKTPLQHGNRPGSNRKRSRSRPAGLQYTNNSYRRAIHRACEVAFQMPEELRCVDKKQPPERIAELRRQAKGWRDKHFWSPNQLRHRAATEIRREFGLDAAQAVMSHANRATTEGYAELDLALGVNVAKSAG
jgi:hypothetical protein